MSGPGGIPLQTGAKMIQNSLVRAPRAKQLRGMPDYPMIALNLLQATGSSEWVIDDLGLVRGIKFDDDVRMSFTPQPLPQMKMSKLMVVVEYRAVDEDAAFGMELWHVSNGGSPKGMKTDPEIPVVCAAGTRGRWGFEIDLSTMKTTDVFSCSVKFMPKKAKDEDGNEAERGVPMLVTGVWLHIDD